MRKVLCIAIVSLCCIGIVGTAQALPLPLPPGTSVDISTSVALPTGGGGNTLVASISPTAFSGVDIFGDILYTGSFSEWVYSNSDGLLFVYQFSNDPNPVGASNDSIGKMTVINYQGFGILDVGAYQGDGTLDQPYSASRNSTGRTVGFLYTNASPSDGGVAPGVQTSLAWVQTDAQYYGPGAVTFQNGAVTQVRALGPVVPEPASMALLGLGLLGLVRSRRRKN